MSLFEWIVFLIALLILETILTIIAFFAGYDVGARNQAKADKDDFSSEINDIFEQARRVDFAKKILAVDKNDDTVPPTQ